MSSRPLGGWWLNLTLNGDWTELIASMHDKPEF
jgi:hypothetical protein